MVSVDFFTVPTIRFQVLYVFLVLAHDRRRILHFGVTAHPTAEWTAQQLREAFPWDTAPRYLLRDRDGIFGPEFMDQVKAFGIRQVLSAPRSPWQRAYVEWVIGTIRRERLDHVIVFNEASPPRAGQRHAGSAARAVAGTGSRHCDPPSWRSSPPLRAARSLNLAVLAAIYYPGQLCQFLLHDTTSGPSIANLILDFSCSSIVPTKRGPGIQFAGAMCQPPFGCRWNLR
jgi:transposase InsO family protein